MANADRGSSITTARSARLQVADLFAAHEGFHDNAVRLSRGIYYEAPNEQVELAAIQRIFNLIGVASEKESDTCAAFVRDVAPKGSIFVPTARHALADKRESAAPVRPASRATVADLFVTKPPAQTLAAHL